MTSKRYNIKNWTRQNLRDWFKIHEKSSSNVKSFRADQVFKWLYQKKAENFDQMLSVDELQSINGGVKRGGCIWPPIQFPFPPIIWPKPSPTFPESPENNDVKR